MIKRIFAILLSLSVLPICASAYADDAYIGSETHNIYVEGKAENGTGTVTLKMTDSNNSVGYISEIDVNSDNTYSYKFKFNKDYSDYKLSINNGAENITDTVIKTADETAGLIGTVNVSDFKDNTVSVNADIINKLDDEGKCKLYFASYNSDGALISVQEEDLNYDYTSGSGSIIKSVPENTNSVKIFMWKSLSNCIPLAVPGKVMPKKDVILIGDSLGQAYSADSIRKGWGEYIGNYMAYGAKINNQCHAGWNTNTYIGDTKNGWDYSKQFIGNGDIVIFGIGYNDYATMGYNGKYYDTVGGERKIYSTGSTGAPFDGMQYTQEKDDNGTYIVSEEQGKIYLADGINTETSKDGMMTYLYKNENGELSSYAADCFIDNMRIMLDYCKETGAEVVVRNIASISSRNGQSTSSNYYGYVTQAIINQKIPSLADEYDNVTAVDLFTETHNHFAEIYDNAPESQSYFFDKNGDRLPYINSDGKQQQLIDKYWITIKSCEEFFDGGYAEQRNGKWGYYTSTGKFVEQDTLHYTAAGADYIAGATAKVIKESDSPIKEYFK